MKYISVIGSGTMGNGIAHVFAQNGFQVSLVDVSHEQLQKAIKTIEFNLDRQLSKEAITTEVRDVTLSNIQTFTDLKDGVSSADLVIEAASENEEVKFDIFRKLDVLTDESCILATNTSSISITKIASATKRSDRII